MPLGSSIEHLNYHPASMLPDHQQHYGRYQPMEKVDHNRQDVSFGVDVPVHVARQNVIPAQANYHQTIELDGHSGREGYHDASFDTDGLPHRNVIPAQVAYYHQPVEPDGHSGQDASFSTGVDVPVRVARQDLVPAQITHHHHQSVEPEGNYGYEGYQDIPFGSSADVPAHAAHQNVLPAQNIYHQTVGPDGHSGQEGYRYHHDGQGAPVGVYHNSDQDPYASDALPFHFGRPIPETNSQFRFGHGQTYGDLNSAYSQGATPADESRFSRETGTTSTPELTFHNTGASRLHSPKQTVTMQYASPNPDSSVTVSSLPNSAIGFNNNVYTTVSGLFPHPYNNSVGGPTSGSTEHTTQKMSKRKEKPTSPVESGHRAKRQMRAERLSESSKTSRRTYSLSSSSSNSQPKTNPYPNVSAPSTSLAVTRDQTGVPSTSHAARPRERLPVKQNKNTVSAANGRNRRNGSSTTTGQTTQLDNNAKNNLKECIYSLDPNLGYQIFLGPESFAKDTITKMRTCQWIVGSPNPREMGAPVCGYVMQSFEDGIFHMKTHLPLSRRSGTIKCMWKDCGGNMSRHMFGQHCSTTHLPWVNVCMACGQTVNFYRYKMIHRRGAGEDGEEDKKSACVKTKEVTPDLLRRTLAYYGRTDGKAMECLRKILGH
ncbi:hypothetical protein VKT23_015484 [Stygiomarasmius scandens]|uniref:C2H2-type domain-containing protein n=1 Tax=Marasmiellus scandens TaxID=2682957 RepID=A0ABR1J2B0_9AGAR